MADIKTRDTSKGTIKTINKAAVATERMKKAYVMTKDKAEHSTNASENSAEEYASDKIEAATDRTVHETTEYLEAFLRNLLLKEKKELHNRNLHISGLLNEEKVDIQDEKVNIESVLSEKK